MTGIRSRSILGGLLMTRPLHYARFLIAWRTLLMKAKGQLVITGNSCLRDVVWVGNGETLAKAIERERKRDSRRSKR